MVKRETHDQELALDEGRGTEQLKARLLAVRKRKQSLGRRTPTIEAVRKRLIDEQRGECGR